MDDRIINQFGNRPSCVGQNYGNIYNGSEDYVSDTASAFEDESYELSSYTPTIQPTIKRDEVTQIIDWIAKDTSSERPNRVALLYGKAGIGKSVVMHDLLIELQSNKDYIVLGLKSDLIEITDDLHKKMHLDKPIINVIKEINQNYKRVILLVDQIDALSLSLSSNRAPLRSILKLIDQIKSIEHVRVIISCRPYDLEYDPLLNKLKGNSKWELKELTKEQVYHILNENGYKNNNISKNLFTLLGNPLNLYLFLKVYPYSQLKDPITSDLLYNEFWKNYIINVDEKKINKKTLLDLLDAIVNAMYQRQELSVHKRNYETLYTKELEYLSSIGLLTVTRNDQLQFFHQTLFDYIYARRFIEQKNDLLEGLRLQHQGLFSRSAVKSILTFMRELNPQRYIETLKHLLFDKNTNGSCIYRYHLQSLALTNMVFFDKPIKEELTFISRNIYNNDLYMGVILESIHSNDWFKEIWKIIDRNGGWMHLSKNYKDKVMIMCQRTLWSSPDQVLDIVDKLLNYNNKEDYQYIRNLMIYNNFNCSAKKLISIYNKLADKKNTIEYTDLLKSIIKENPTFVCNVLKENVSVQLLEKNTTISSSIQISHDVEELYEELFKQHHEHAIALYVEILKLIFDSSKFDIPESEISSSLDLSNFYRISEGNFASNFTQDLINFILDDFLKNTNGEYVERYLNEFSKSKYEGFVFIALYIFTAKPIIYRDHVYNLIISRSILSNSTCMVEYQAIEALKNTFCLMSDTQKEIIINKILTIHDYSEEKIYFKENLNDRLQYGHPLLDLGLQKGKILKIIPIEELTNYPKAYQEYLRLNRKFNKERLTNEMPFQTRTMAGWTSLTYEQASKMSHKTWYNSMQKYNNDNSSDWDRPSLTGQCQLFRNVVSKNPDKYMDLLDEVITCETIPLAYAEAGMRGYIDAGRIKEAEHVFKSIISVIGNDVNFSTRGLTSHSLLYSFLDIVKSEDIPDSIFNFICNLTIYAEETIVDKGHNEKDIYKIGLNQTRGNAGYLLVECAKFDKFKERIFQTIESIAETASVYTRAAILLNMAILNNIDKDRNVRLFKKLMHDFDPRLMAMPIHAHNPLVYFINYAVNDMKDLFNHAVNYPECYEQQVIIMWLAWSHNRRDKDIKILLDRMCESSQEARISLLRFFDTLENIDNDAITYILYFMELRFDSPEMGERCDKIFTKVKFLPKEEQINIADKFVSSPLCVYKVNSFIKYLAGYAIEDPIRSLSWLNKIIEKNSLDNYHIWNQVTDVLIQSYNGLKSFRDSRYQDILEHAMDLIDQLMQNQNNKFLITNFINKLDNE